MQFLNAPVLFALVIAGIPILIHLLNRRRFKIIDWAPMKYLKLTIRTNRRRLQIEQLLLLALRTALMLLLVFTLARIALAKSGLGGWLSKRSRVSRVIVLDTSLPMGYRTANTSELDLAKDALIEIINSTGSQDAVTVLTTTPGAAPLVREATLDNPGKIIAQVKALQCTDAANQWAGIFKNIDAALSTATFPQKQLILISDGRRNGWTSEVTEQANRWAAAGIEARLVDVGSHATADVSLARFVQDDPIALPGENLHISATIRNDTTSPLSGAQATLKVDDESRPVVLPTVPAGATTDVPLSVTFDKPGQHQLHFALPDDALNADNIRHLSVNVRDRLSLVLVDGREGAGPFESSSDFLQVAFSIGQEPWHVQKIGDADPQALRPVPADITAMTDAANLPPSAITQYESLVKQGMGMMIFAGEQVDPQLYNDRLYKNGTGLLPGRVDHIVDGPVKGLVIEKYADSPLAPLAKLLPELLARVSTRRLLAIDLPDHLPPDVRVLARWNDAEAHPAIIEKRVGRGRVLLWTTSADREWTDWPVDKTYVLAVRSAAISIAWPDSLDDNLTAGHELVFHPQDDQPRLNPRIITPDDPTPAPLPLLRTPNTATAGIYSLLWTDAQKAEQRHQVAVSFDRSASLEPLPQDQFSQLMGNLKCDWVEYHPGQLASAGAGKEIWRTLAAVMLGLFLVESVFAFYVGRER